MAWIISILLFCITSVCAGFYSGNWRNIQNTLRRLVKKIYDTYIWCVILIYIGWRMQGWLQGQSHTLKTAIMVPRKRLSRAIAATCPWGPNVKNVYLYYRYNFCNHIRMHMCLIKLINHCSRNGMLPIQSTSLLEVVRYYHINSQE